MLLRRRAGVGLLGATAVAGGMYAVGSANARRSSEQAYHEQAQEQRIRDLEASQQQQPPQYAPPPPAYAPPPPQTMATPAPPAATPSSSSESIATLKELAQMRSDGLLTDEEFQRAKEKFLA